MNKVGKCVPDWMANAQSAVYLEHLKAPIPVIKRPSNSFPLVLDRKKTQYRYAKTSCVILIENCLRCRKTCSTGLSFSLLW